MPPQQAMPIPSGMPATSGSTTMGPFMGPFVYPPNYFPHQYSSSSSSTGPKPGEGGFYSPYYVAVPPPSPPQAHGGQDGDNQGYPPPPPQYFAAPFLASYPQHFQTYMVHRADGQASLPGQHYGAYAPMYPKPPSAGSSSEFIGNIRDSEGRGVEKSG